MALKKTDPLSWQLSEAKAPRACWDFVWLETVWSVHAVTTATEFCVTARPLSGKYHVLEVTHHFWLLHSFPSCTTTPDACVCSCYEHSISGQPSAVSYSRHADHVRVFLFKKLLASRVP